MAQMKKPDPALAKQVKKDVKFLKEKAADKKTTTKGSVAKTFDTSKLMPKMTPQDKAMLKILKKKYGNDVYKK